MTQSFLRAAGLALAILATVPAEAHHSFAMFDKTKLVSIKGSVSKVEWTNPHAYLFVVNPAAPTKIYAFECSSPNELNRWGWKANTIKVGDTVTVQFFPLKDGSPGGLVYSVSLPNGKVVKAN